jgi:polar amino acid transport system permease protein
MRYDFNIILKDFHLFLPAAFETLKITAVSIVFGMFLGIIIAMMRLSKNKLINIPASIFVYIIRGTPILLQLLIIYYGMTGFIKLEAFPSAVIAFGVHFSAYIAEILRGAVISIDSGQREAALSLGMTKFQAFRRVVLPQAFKRAIPPLGNQFIIATKDSSLASAIAVRELLLKSQQLGSSTFHQLEYLLIAGIYYLLITMILGIVVHKLEKNLAVSSREGGE